MTIYKHHHTDIDRGAVDFGLRDKKGRAVGYRWTITDVKCEPLPADVTYGYSCGTDHIRVWTTPTRDGLNYGPASHWAKRTTVDEARVLIDKRIAAARARDGRKFGGAR